jgi:hypothetical protein
MEPMQTSWEVIAYMDGSAGPVHDAPEQAQLRESLARAM